MQGLRVRGDADGAAQPSPSSSLGTGSRVLQESDETLEAAEVRVAQDDAHSGAGLAPSRKSNPPSQDGVPVLQSRSVERQAREELAPELLNQMLANCLKLASENKITQKNTWELKLIDHASDLVLADHDDGSQTNFQKASCVLETGMKIYATRVDATHSETYKVLGGLNRTTAEQADTDAEGGDADGGEDEERQGEARKERKGHSATLEPTLEALNLKKFDTAFAVDPLFHQTSAQFDEGGAKGLLLNNLSVFRGCEIVFDSGDIPDRGSAKPGPNPGSDKWANLTFLQDRIQAMCRGVQRALHISPTLQEIVKLLNDPYRAAAEAKTADESSVGGPSGEAFSTPGKGEAAQPPLDFGWGGGADFAANMDDDFGSMGGGTIGGVLMTMMRGSDVEEDVVRWLEGGAEGRGKSWAGADHWRARGRPKDTEDHGAADAPPKPKRPRNAPFLLDFENLPDLSDPQYAPADDEREICLAPSALTTDAKTLLPEDLHYQPMWLARLFLRPNVVCIPRKVRVPAGTRGGSEAGPAFATQMDFGDAGDFWGDDDDDNGAGGSPFVGGADWNAPDGPEDEADGLVEQPRQVEKVDVNYARTSKQVDVKILKETLWTGLQCAPGQEEEDASEGSRKDGVSFRGLLEHIPADCAAAELPDISVHLCFICVLHLANEHGLAIAGTETMDELVIDKVPFA
ncbi:Chromosome condensation complex Condensin subunit H [Klebsormidium nitens]|uniref:Condensin complex subunit 2 n=1 Tax=Klebsormidium nitens TaxID=105231 RepID=A0A1Y1HTG4_KLENI|nr:Chromosome condensation complex Condensin subunit H [Klebsormidium nitens]|eukprot:GAQ79827.1 Chromosome condensation complex Condensin subunit H [Klebsormidium nitens]